MPQNPRTLLATLTCLLTLTSPALSRPPIVDPTYGLPIPALRPTATAPTVAKWIWSAQTAGAQTVQVRGTVTLAKAPKAALLYVTGDDAFTAWVNGHPVDSSVSVEQGWKQVHRCPVGQWLHAGRNVVAIQGTNDGGAAGLLAELAVNGVAVLCTDEHWKASETKTLTTAWTADDFDDANWPAATAIAPVGQGPWSNQLAGWPGLENAAWYMAHRTIRPVMLETQVAGSASKSLSLNRSADAVTIPPIPAGAAPTMVMVDFGQELAGRLEIVGTTGAKVTVTTGETREECTHDEPALDNRGPWSLTLGDADNLAATPYTAFRYARIVVPAGQGEVKLTRIDCDHKYYPVTYRGSFDCSDPALTQLWYAGAYTAHLCMQEEIWDAPKRDRGLWCGDLQVTGATINDVFGDRFLMEHSIERLRAEAQKGKPDTDPASAEINTLPGYSAAWFCELADYYQSSGNIDFLRSQHDRIIGLLEFQKTDFDEHNLFVNPRKDWNFVDWAPDFVVDSPQARIATDLFTIGGVRTAVALLRTLGDNASAAKYAAWADTLTAAAQTAYADPQTQTFGNRLQTNTMAVFAGVATPVQRDAIYTRILRSDSPVWRAPDPQPGNLDSYPMTPYYGFFVLQDFGKLNCPQDGLDLIRRYWSPMLQRGTTTLWEKFDPALPTDMHTILDRMPYLSFCHGWSTGPTPFLSEYILGVQPTTPGGKSIRIAPFLGDLRWVEGDFPTPQGNIHVRAERDKAGRIVETVKLPSGIDAEIGIPAGASGITLNGHRADGARQEGNMSFVRVSRAGTYRVTAD